MKGTGQKLCFPEEYLDILRGKVKENPSYKLLSVLADHKTQKGVKFGWLSGVLYLAPHDVGTPGWSVCPFSGQSCREVCLARAGLLELPAAMKAKLRRKLQFKHKRAEFLKMLEHDLAALERQAKRYKLKPCVRLNGTSDIPWEIVAPELFRKFKKIQFYDYTKAYPRLEKRLPKNYYLVFSWLPEWPEKVIKKALKKTAICAAFDTKPREALPNFYTLPNAPSLGALPVVDADLHDLRFIDGKPGIICGLRAKGHLRTVKEHPFKLPVAWAGKKRNVPGNPTWDPKTGVKPSSPEPARKLAQVNPKSTEVQSLLIPKKTYTKAQAKAWAKRHGFFYGEVDSAKSYWRLRQGEPGAYRKGSFRTITLGKGIKAVIAKPRRNPQLMVVSNPSRSAKAAEEAFRKFHEMEPPKPKRIGKGKGILVSLGRIREVVYEPRRGGRADSAWRHKFRNARLAATPDGKHLLIVPGSPKAKIRVDWERGIIG